MTRLEGASTVQANGAGGIWASARDRALTELKLQALGPELIVVADNGGPGRLAEGRVGLGQVHVTSNGGDGVVLPFQESFLGDRLDVQYGEVSIANNGGHGIFMDSRDMRASNATLSVQSNCGWGIWVDGARFRYDSTYGNLTVEDNGRGASGSFFDGVNGEVTSVVGDCAGGGVRLTGLEADTEIEASELQEALIANNAGPGLASSGRVRLISAQLRGNGGPGLLFVEELEAVTEQTPVVTLQGNTAIEDNQGSGVEAGGGRIRVTGNAVLANNAGAGIQKDLGDIQLNTGGDSGTSWVRGHVNAALSCRSWTIASGSWTGAPGATCARNEGLWTADGNITGVGTIIRDNAGAGVSAADPDALGVGIVTIEGGQLCDNGAPDVAVQFNLTSMSCP